MNKETVKHYFSYVGGHLIRNFTSGGSIAGSKVGSKNDQGYEQVQIDGKKHKVHRLVFLYHYGYLPKNIDHINGFRDDNRIENLRKCSRSQNQMNEKLRPNNTSGIKGVSWCKSAERWRARVQAYGQVKYVGNFKSRAKAEQAVKDARLELHGEFSRHK
jgi:hypothetical protein